MPSRRVEDHAFKFGLTFNESKRRLGLKHGKRRQHVVAEAKAGGKRAKKLAAKAAKPKGKK